MVVSSIMPLVSSIHIFDGVAIGDTDFDYVIGSEGVSVEALVVACRRHLCTIHQSIQATHGGASGVPTSNDRPSTALIFLSLFKFEF